ELTPELIKQLGYRLFPIDQLIPLNELSRYVNAEKKIDLEYKKTNHSRNYPGYSKLCTLNREKRDILKLKIEEVLLIQDAISKHLYPWAKKVSQEISGGQIQSWKNILVSTIEQVDIIDRLQKETGNLNIIGLDGKNLQLVGDHANALKKHLENGKRLGFGPFRARVVKDGLYLVKLVKVNEKNCTSIPVLKQLISWIQISIRSKKLTDLWKNITAPPSGDVAQQCPIYRDRCELIKHAMLIHDRIEDARKTLNDCPGIHLPAWHQQGEVQAFLNAIDALNVEDDFKVAQHIFESLTESLAIFTNSSNFHPTTEQIKEAITNRDIALYNSTYESLVYLNSNANSLAFFNEVINRFNKCAPKTCKNFNESYSNSEWKNRFTEFESAWGWAKTDCWLVEMSDKERPDRIRQELEKSIKSEKNALKNLAAAKAWQFCMKNMGEKERMDLVAWENAIKKIRGGHGKKVEFWREEARERMEGCRKSIPAWIMPLYQVVQTVRVKQSAFDVAVIDEASQSGPIGIFLRYIADKIIVVGDDEQITPVYVGVELEQAHYLMRKYLFDIPYASALLPARENSLFSEARLHFGDPLLLTEHFRCMPEIIQFSNNISYVKDHLIPLRQYGVDRLEPVRSVFIKNGYRKGSSESIENQPEAEALAAQIAECCEDHAYSGKTFGVISLMGNKQAELINSLLLKEIGAEKMEERRLICGRPYDFQGDERDVMFLSMVDAPQDGNPCRKMSDPDTRRRFNVAASRARDQLWLFHSASLNDLKKDCYRYRLVQYCMNPAVMQTEEIGETTITELRRSAHDSSRRKPGKISGTPFDSWFEVDVFFKIIDRGYRVLPQYPVNERRIDLVVEGLYGRLAVECDGDEAHMDRWEDDQIRQKELERYGWTFWRVRGGDYYRDPDKALEELWETLERLKITPRYKWESEKDQSKKQETSDAYTSGEYTEADETEDIEKETIEDVSEHKTEKGPQRKKDETDRLDSVLGYIQALKKRPEETPPYEIQNAVLKLLKKCPNHSCTLKSLTSRVLKELGLATRGNPRLEFEKRVMRNLSVLWRKGYILEYKAKNKRVKLVDLSINKS
ncbi:MAG: DUF559 domain-containing protein, partial [Acidobacteria bacterium]|nr:DUF559 domain-containing protein [Acidobacteriota bacterium]